MDQQHHRLKLCRLFAFAEDYFLPFAAQNERQIFRRVCVVECNKPHRAPTTPYVGVIYWCIFIGKHIVGATYAQIYASGWYALNAVARSDLMLQLIA